MFPKILSTITAVSVIATNIIIQPTPVAQNMKEPHVLAAHSFSLEDRYNDKFVNDVFKNNILLELAYFNGKVVDRANIDWKSVVKPFSFDITLKPNEVFAFHDAVLPEYQDKIIKTVKNVQFGAQDGFLSDGYLSGDGLCHLASFINWVAKDAKLDVTTLVNHDFANIPDVPKEYGVAIYADGSKDESSERQNLYVTNNQKKPIKLAFNYDGKDLQIKVLEDI